MMLLFFLIPALPACSGTSHPDDDREPRTSRPQAEHRESWYVFMLGAGFAIWSVLPAASTPVDHYPPYSTRAAGRTWCRAWSGCSSAGQLDHDRD